MHRILVIAGLMLLSGGIANAACNRYEVAGGYQFARVYTNVRVTTEPSGTGSGTSNLTGLDANYSGWSGEVAVNATCWVGLVADFTGTYGSPQFEGGHISGSTYDYIFGPRFSYRNATPITPFFEMLVGGATTSVKSSLPFPILPIHGTYSSIAAAFGGGVDVTVSDHWAIRGEGNYALSDFGNIRQNDLAITGKLVYRFGHAGK